MNRFELKSKELIKLQVKTTVMQIIALILACVIGIYLNEKDLLLEQLYIIPCYILVGLLLIRFNNKEITKIEKL